MTEPESPDFLNRDRLRALVRITAAVALRNEVLLAQELQSALEQRLPVALIREVILQTYLFAGYAAAINAFVVLNRLTGPHSEYFTEPESSLELWKKRGTDLCKKIYGEPFAKLMENMKELHPDLADWMIWEGYGKVLSRPFLSPEIRELLIVAITAVLAVERQFYSHVRGALQVGCGAEDLRFVFAQVKEFIHKVSIPAFQKILEDLTSS